jgi:heme oxygenase
VHVLGALRAATSEAHTRLSTSLDPSRVCATRSSYTRFLAALFGFHAAVERALGPVALSGVGASPRRSALLAADLQFLGTPAATLPVMPWTTPVEAPGARYGVAYVVEGSALGGLLLGRLAREQLQLGPQYGASFFALGSGEAHRWRQVKAALEQDVAGARLAPAAAAAAATFEQLERWMHAQGVVAPAGAAVPAARSERSRSSVAPSAEPYPSSSSSLTGQRSASSRSRNSAKPTT